MKKIIKFIAAYASYTKGDIAGFDHKTAEKLIYGKVAVAYVAKATGIDITVGASEEIGAVLSDLEEREAELSAAQKDIATKDAALSAYSKELDAQRVALAKSEKSLEKREAAANAAEAALVDDESKAGSESLPNQGVKPQSATK
ncbi:MAG: hypothetical protein JKY93_03315 [Gammaproteobacteria bacterium]|nr:hypothetical protein [Gammaproteobacteria bacterium]